jgi:transcriptional regulator
MLVQRHFAIQSMEDVRRLVQRHGWASLVVAGQEGLQAAHIPCLLDPDHDEGVDAPELVVLGHTARADPVSAQLDREREVLLIFQGPNGYISPDWYGAAPFVPTWNFTAVHVHGVPEVLEGDEGFAVLERTVEHFEAAREEGNHMRDEPRRGCQAYPGHEAVERRSTRRSGCRLTSSRREGL